MIPQLLMAGKLGLKFLPVIGAVSGAAPGLRKGNIGEAALGAGFGALTGGTGVGATNLARRKAAQFAGGEAVQRFLGSTGLGMTGLSPAVLQRATRAAVPLAGIAATSRLAGGLGGGGAQAASPTLGGAAGLLGYNTIGNEGMGGVPLPPGMGPYGNVGPTGLPLDVLSPLGVEAGQRLRTQKDAESLRDATNIVLPTLRKFSEQAKKDDFARSIAARGIAQNIATNALLTQGMAQATRNLGTTAAEQAGSALTQQYNY
tara:strand:+ start:3797 stop:4573 length:777 start_codon:yes stop_codon:yes gene_type:complete